jgi:flavorubredoxin
VIVVRSVVVYGSRSGNTRRVAEAVAGALQAYGPVRLFAAEDASATVWDHCELLVVGGPTEGRHATPPVRAFFERLPAEALHGIAAAAFDTRLDWPRLLSGSAAAVIRRWLDDAGARVVVPPESFKVTQEPRLQAGELERAPIWARGLAEVVPARSDACSTAHPVAA